jgi:hypothetical protein
MSEPTMTRAEMAQRLNDLWEQLEEEVAEAKAKEEALDLVNTGTLGVTTWPSDLPRQH